MTEGFQTVLAASERERRDLFSPLPTGSAPPNRTSRKTSGYAGPSMRSSTALNPAARACFSRAEHRSPKATA